MLLATVLALTVPQATAPAHHDQTCPATPTPLPAGLESWARPTRVTAGSSAKKAMALTVGTAATASLRPTPAYAVRPEKPGASATHGGLFAFTVSQPGRYRVALGSAAWVDVLAGRVAVASVAHGHGPACSTVRKMVDFDLKPGRYLLQVAGNANPTLPLMVAHLP